MNKATSNTITKEGDYTERAGSASVLIAIPTYRRPESLMRLLNAIAGLETTADIRILVADNEGDNGAGMAVVANLPVDFRFPVVCMPVPARGLANVRNAMIAFACEAPEADYIAMIDDDERPLPQWIDSLIETQKRFDCDVTGGPTEPVFVPGAPDWAKYCPLFRCGDFPDGRVDMIWGTCNVMFHRRVLAHIGESGLFDNAFNDLGGEDVDAFMRLKSLGCTFAWTNSAVVLDDIPAARTTWRWITRRAFRIGNSNMLTQLRWKYTSHGRLAAVIPAMCAVMIHATLLVLTVPSKRLRMNYFCSFVRSWGKLAYLAGFRLNEYSPMR